MRGCLPPRCAGWVEVVGIVTTGDLLELLEPRRPAPFPHVLVAVDLGPASGAVVTAGIELARQHVARL